MISFNGENKEVEVLLNKYIFAARLADAQALATLGTASDEAKILQNRFGWLLNAHEH